MARMVEIEFEVWTKRPLGGGWRRHGRKRVGLVDPNARAADLEQIRLAVALAEFRGERDLPNIKLHYRWHGERQEYP